jgi:hypothetical protein
MGGIPRRRCVVRDECDACAAFVSRFLDDDGAISRAREM